jgi:hypothetical protein
MVPTKPRKQNDPNNARLRALIKRSKLSQPEALERFNEGLVKPYSLSVWKAYLADPDSVRWRRFDPLLLRHAETALRPAAPQKGARTRE